ncbi:MAG: GNAT family N-acetyltransferase [Sphingosinicella sp.]|nr:GNAT family N-acetyltransferase [Sphingosinicella sp.]
MATKADAAAMSVLGQQSFIETFGDLYRPEDLDTFLQRHSEDRWREELRDEGISVRIAEQQGIFIGFAKVTPLALPVTAGGSPVELAQFYILKPWQGEGIAAPLMEWVLGEARSRGADALFLSVFSENHRARRFYDRYGFVFVQPYAFMVGDQADEDHILRLDLRKRRPS